MILAFLSRQHNSDGSGSRFAEFTISLFFICTYIQGSCDLAGLRESFGQVEEELWLP